MNTYQQVADRTATTVPPHLQAEMTVPIVNLSDDKPAARQGDVMIVPHATPFPTGPINGKPKTLTGTGFKVVQGDADRNSHILNGDGTFTPCQPVSRVADYGILDVPEGGVCYLTHTDEHGSIGFGPGQWRVYGQVSYEQELRRAAD